MGNNPKYPETKNFLPWGKKESFLGDRRAKVKNIFWHSWSRANSRPKRKTV
jgi:hypothetical protein